MRNKFIPLAVALIFGSIAAVGFSKMNKAAPQAETVEIYVASRVIDSSEEVKEDAVKLERWPAKNVPADAIKKWEDLEGQFVAQRIFEGEPVLVRKLLDPKQAKGGIPTGFTTIDLDASEASGISNLVAPGDYVNVIGFFPKRDVIPETTTKTVLSGIRVYAVDGRTTREDKKENADKGGVKVVSLVMHPQDAEAWTWAKELGKVSLSLGRPDANSLDETGPNAAGQEFLAWLSRLQAAKNEKPAVVAKPVETSPEVEHKMVKVGPNGQIVVYTWEKGNPVPVISSTDSPGGDTSASPSGKNDNLSVLSGEDSPLFSEPAADTSVDNPDYNPFQNMQQR